MYDITSSQSFSDISYWANCIQVLLELRCCCSVDCSHHNFAFHVFSTGVPIENGNNVCLQESASDNVTILMLGNKSDSGTRQVKSQDGESLAKVWRRWLITSIALWAVLIAECLLSDSTGVQLSVHGVQRCHRPQCDSVIGDYGQVTYLRLTKSGPCIELWCTATVWSYMFFCDNHPGCWVKSATRGRKLCYYAKSPRRKNHQDVAKKKMKKFWLGFKFYN